MTIGGNGTFGYADSTNGIAAAFNDPEKLVADATGNIYVADTGNGSIRRIDAATGAVPPAPSGLTQVHVTYWVNNPLIRYNRTGSPSTDSTTLASKTFLYPNPGTSAVSLVCTLPRASQGATVEFISSLTGKTIRKFLFENLPSGPQTLPLDVRELASGFYTYRLITESQVLTGRFAKE